MIDTSRKKKMHKKLTQNCFLKKKKEQKQKPTKINEKIHVQKKIKENRQKQKKKKKPTRWRLRGELQRYFWKLHELSSLSFLSILERKLFGGFGEKIPRSHYLFSFLPTQLNTLQKNFPFHFLSKIFHPLYFTSKQTHLECPIF